MKVCLYVILFFILFMKYKVFNLNFNMYHDFFFFENGKLLFMVLLFEDHFFHNIYDSILL